MIDLALSGYAERPACPPAFPYNRNAAVAYAHKWAYQRNPAYYNYDKLGGDCTNFASQCVFAGSGVMNSTPVYGWFYFNSNQKAPAWTGVPYFYNFMTRAKYSFLPRGKCSPGPFGVESGMEDVLPGDLVQLNFNGEEFGHTPVIVSIGNPPSLANILVAAHTYDADNKPLAAYDVLSMRFIHILGVYQKIK
ncbi:MAG: amidase domain-containing protein [Oscillospiraceae bacterium]|nr:amidase domain-containing protein [Oscillospiraceae bacterium]